jgi:uncharacterized protein YodC (DUF2158 family)
MASEFKKGDVVKLDTVVPEGPVQSIRMTEEGVVQYLVGWTDVYGVEHERWFDEEQLIGA